MMKMRLPALALLLLSLLLPGLASGDDVVPAATPEPAANAGASATPGIEPGIERRLRESGTPELIEPWIQARRTFETTFVDQEEDPAGSLEGFLSAGKQFEAIAHRTRGMGEAHWRAARGYWLAAEMYPVEQNADRLPLYEAAAEISRLGIEADPDCAGCMLWRVSSMGRIQTALGTFSAVRMVPEMADLLDRAIALQPSYADNEDNSTLGNLHYASAILYRVLPDSIWLKWLVGVRGDRERALSHARIALQRHPGRLDYAVEMGAQLLCLGTREDQPKRIREGRRLLRRAQERKAENEHDLRQIVAAGIMLAQPRKSCGFTGDAWVDVDEAMKKRSS